jgi:tetratricopeptide (TPR) repeat protein
MRKSVRNLVIGLSAIAAVAAVSLTLFFVGFFGEGAVEDVLAAASLAGFTERRYGRLTIEYPLDETLFPPEIAPPTFRWKDDNPGSDMWLVTIELPLLPKGAGRINRLTREPRWRPKRSLWETIKKCSIDKQATVTIVGVNQKSPKDILSAGQIGIKTSSDKVAAPIFYREVNLPFVEAVKDPSLIRWRFGAISSSQQPPIVLDQLPVCGNCHSFSADAAVLGMDVDYANDKGSYAIAAVHEYMTLDKDKIITWSDYKRGEGEGTYGLLSQVSPDGRFVVSTVKDESVFAPKPGLDFSQLFFPVKGILCIYDRQTGVFESLPGADDPNLVQSNPTWSPDGKHIVFAATEAYRLKNISGPRKVLLSADECREFLEDGKPFKFDLYRIPFNGGKGGEPEPLEGASFNGMSNFFARYSPDGKWIVFCKAENYMLLQPDSELYIIPAEGGEARRLRANTKRMNSWHSFSPNGKWLVFSGKPDSAYTRLFLTHIDEQGQSTPAVVLDHMTAPDRAANIPEFVNADAGAIRRIREQFVDDLSYVRAAKEFLKSGDYQGVERQCRKALALNPKNAAAYYCLGLAMFGRGAYDEAIRNLLQATRIEPLNGEAHTHLGVAYVGKGMLNEAVSHLQKALQIDPNNAEAHFNLGVAMFRRKNNQEAIKCWSQTVRLTPNDHEAHYYLAQALEAEGYVDKAIEHYASTVQLKPDHSKAHARLGLALCAKGSLKEATLHLSEAVRLEPGDTTVRYNLAVTLARLEQHKQAITHWLELVRLDPSNAGTLVYLAMSYAKTDQLDKALNCLDEALNIARSAGDEKLVGQIIRQIGLYRQNKPPGGVP